MRPIARRNNSHANCRAASLKKPAVPFEEVSAPDDPISKPSRPQTDPRATPDLLQIVPRWTQARFQIDPQIDPRSTPNQ